MVLTGRYAVPTRLDADGAAMQRAIKAALAAVIHQHPILRVGILGEGTANHVYIALPAIDLRHVIEWRVPFGDDGEYMPYLLRSIEAQHDQLWERLDERTAWKLIVHKAKERSVRYLDISFAFHHAVGDAVGLSGDILRFKSSPILPPPLEVIVPFTVSWLYFCAVILFRIWSKLAPSWLTSARPWIDKRISLEPYKTNLRLLLVPNETVTSLIAACRERVTTVTPLLHTLTLASLSCRLPAASARQFRANTPISLRRFTTREFDRANTIHCYVTGHDYLFAASPVFEFREARQIPKPDADTLIWKTAAEMGTSLKSKVSSLPRNDTLALLPWVSDRKQFWLGQVGQPRKDSWACSNAGSLQASESEDKTENGAGWKIERLVFSQGLCRWARPLMSMLRVWKAMGCGLPLAGRRPFWMRRWSSGLPGTCRRGLVGLERMGIFNRMRSGVRA